MDNGGVFDVNHSIFIMFTEIFKHAVSQNRASVGKWKPLIKEKM